MNEMCPFCGIEPEVCVTPLWDGSHGYRDCYDITVECKNAECPVKPKTRGYNTIYGGTTGEMIKEASRAWNTRA